MFNFRVDDLEAALGEFRKAGVTILKEIEDFEYGRFAQIADPEGNPIELWQPAEGY
jgi:predicted enzyme related to lactoylglutathione lyase